jgi:hypothetical protein
MRFNRLEAGLTSRTDDVPFEHGVQIWEARSETILRMGHLWPHRLARWVADLPNAATRAPGGLLSIGPLSAG